MRQAPPRLSRLSTKGRQARPYPLSWVEQDRLFQLLPRHLADAALFAVNTGCREQEVCQLRWDWVVEIPDMQTSVFILPDTITKTSTERVVVLNSVASRVIESRHGMNREFVFTYRERPIGKLHSSAWCCLSDYPPGTFPNYSWPSDRRIPGLIHISDQSGKVERSGREVGRESWRTAGDGAPRGKA